MRTDRLMRMRKEHNFHVVVSSETKNWWRYGGPRAYSVRCRNRIRTVTSNMDLLPEHQIRSPNRWLSTSAWIRAFYWRASIALSVIECTLPMRTFGSWTQLASSSLAHTHMPSRPFHLWFPNFNANISSNSPGKEVRFQSKWPPCSSWMLCMIQQVENALTMPDCVCNRLKLFRNLKHFFKTSNKPSISSLTDSNFALYCMIGEPGIASLCEFIRHGQRRYPPSQMR